ncbi:ribonuclease H-like domain-containing protein [Candidatus Woesearchaeota archaeon]|nr:ribonuclease H-like domain-containing protein [Candidatus Woesearchaeota archaeon]
MKLQFVAYDFEYVLKEDRVLVLIYGKDVKDRKVCIHIAHEPYFYATIPHEGRETFETNLVKMKLSENVDNRGACVTRFEVVEKEFLGRKGNYYKIYTNYPKAVPLIAKELEKKGVVTYEKDILFVHRFLRDIGLVPFSAWEAEVNPISIEGQINAEDNNLPHNLLYNIPHNIHHFETSHITSGSFIVPSLQVLAIDIETYAHKKEIDFVKNPILMVAFYGVDAAGEKFEKVISWKKINHSLPYLEIVANEKELLMRFNEVIATYSPDVLLGYFTDGFDFPYLLERASQHKVPFTFGVDRSGLQLRRGAGMRDSEVSVRGILHLDLLKFVKYIFGKNLKTDSYSLNAVAQELLGEKKHDVNLDELSTLWDQNSDKLSLFVEYNLQDTKLTYSLYAKLRLDIEEFTKIVGLPPFDVIRMKFSRLVESYILRRAMEFNVLAPNKPDDEELGERMDESIEGAYVFEPTPGLYKDVVVFDFRSLYPSIITSHNLGPESFKAQDGTTRTPVPGKEEYWFSSKRGFIPKVLEDLILYRSAIKEEIKKAKTQGKEIFFLEARSYAYKILANSFYGYLGFYGARWYCLECAASTTAYARYYIHRTIEKAGQDGFKVVYGDTDSCFFLLGDKKIDDAFSFMKKINDDLPGMMELDFEGYYPRGIFVGMKGSERGAKKKYALLRENGTLKITGFEFVRRNWSVYAKRLQQKVLELVLKDNLSEALAYVKQSIKDLTAGKVPLKELVITTQLTRELSGYTAIGPHVRVARLMVERGESVKAGMMLEYVITKGQGSVGDRASLVMDVKEGEYDSDYYLHHQVLPSVSSIFAVLGYSEDMLLGKGEQKGLGSFFGK